MTVAELIELLRKYDGDRDLIVAGEMATLWHVLSGVRSVEPGGAVLLVSGTYVPRDQMFDSRIEARR